mgnify:FL=1
MQQDDIMKMLESVITGFSYILGSDTEIALHDLKKRELYAIVNGYITGRESGHKMHPSVYDTVLEMARENNYVIGYSSHTPSGEDLRVSHIVINGEEGEPVALICINQKIEKLKEFRDMIDSMIKCTSLKETRSQIVSDVSPEQNYIQNVARQVLLDVIEKSKPSLLDSKQDKIRILEELERKGFFSVKDAAPAVCKMLSISQATLYNYLREIRNANIFDE